MKGDNKKRNMWLTVGAFAILMAIQIILLSACGSNAGDKNEIKTPAATSQSEEGNSVADKVVSSTDQLASSCATECHEMAPEVATWQLSAHSQFECTTCHQVSDKQIQSKRDNNNFSKPIKITNLITNDICQKCHSKNRQATPSGDLLIPHDRHDAKGIPCVKCHAGVVHAKIAERKTTVQSGYDDYKKWTLALAGKVATSYYYAPDMWTCITCHKALSVTTKCTICHTEIPTLPSHEQPVWKVKHGVTARQNVGECTMCHAKPDSPKKLDQPTGDQSADFARLNDFCYNCHTKKPQSHQGQMRQNHPNVAADRGLQNCFTCHDAEQAKPTDNVTGTFCNQCHWFTKEKPAKIPAK